MPKGHHSKFFPGKLFSMLDEVDGLGLAHGASWVSEGRAFAIHDPDIFMSDIAPQFFDKQTHLRSFHRQLSIWGFTRLESGAGGRGVWFHKYFNRDKPELIKHIKRVPVKNPKPSTSQPKSAMPDYSNYQLPPTIQTDASKGGFSKQLNPMPVHHPGDAKPMPMPPQGYMPQGMPQAMPPGYNPVMLANYGQPGVMPPMGPPGAPGIPNVPPGADLGDVAQQLLAYKTSQAAQSGAGGPQSGDRSNVDLNAALLAVIMDSRRRETPAGGAPNAAPGPAAPSAAPAGAAPANAPDASSGLSQELISALAQRNLYPQGPAAAPAAKTSGNV